MRKVLSAFFALLGGLLLSCTTASAQAPKRVALIIGNADYRHVSAVQNADGDAAALGDALGRLGFDVKSLFNADAVSMRRALEEFQRAATDADAALFFFAGHSVRLRGAGRLVPVDASLQDAAGVERDTVALDQVSGALARARNAFLLIDGCADGRLTERLQWAGGTRTGLGPQPSRPGMLIAVASTDERSCAARPFVDSLLVELEVPGLDAARLFSRVQQLAQYRSGGAQEVAVAGSLSNPFVFAREDLPVSAFRRLGVDPALDAMRGHIGKYGSDALTPVLKTAVSEKESLQSRPGAREATRAWNGWIDDSWTRARLEKARASRLEAVEARWSREADAAKQGPKEPRLAALTPAPLPPLAPPAPPPVAPPVVTMPPPPSSPPPPAATIASPPPSAPAPAPREATEKPSRPSAPKLEESPVSRAPTLTPSPPLPPPASQEPKTVTPAPPPAPSPAPTPLEPKTAAPLPTPVPPATPPEPKVVAPIPTPVPPPAAMQPEPKITAPVPTPVPPPAATQPEPKIAAPVPTPVPPPAATQPEPKLTTPIPPSPSPAPTPVEPKTVTVVPATPAVPPPAPKATTVVPPAPLSGPKLEETVPPPPPSLPPPDQKTVGLPATTAPSSPASPPQQAAPTPSTAPADQKMASLAVPSPTPAPMPAPGPAPATPPAAAFNPDSVESIRAAQQELRRLGCYAGGVDGQTGPQTKNAMAAAAGKLGADSGVQPLTEQGLQALRDYKGVLCPPAAVAVKVPPPPAASTAAPAYAPPPVATPAPAPAAPPPVVSNTPAPAPAAPPAAPAAPEKKRIHISM